MNNIRNMPTAGIIVIVAILCLFILAILMLFAICIRYRRCTRATAEGGDGDEFLRATVADYAAAYKSFGQDVNTPAIITSSIRARMGLELFCERFLNNAVSLFVTLGLFGTFLGLSLSVASLTELISYSNTSEWLSVLDSVGGGLMSSLSGMGVAFYTSLVGVACSIVLTILRAVMNPEGLRSALETELELYLDHRVAPTLATDRANDAADLINLMICGMNEAAASMNDTLSNTTDQLRRSLEDSRAQIAAFSNTVAAFNKGVRDFSEFDYSLRGTVERMDIAARDFVTSLRRSGGSAERGE